MKIIIYSIVGLIFGTLYGCSNFLEIKPDKKMAIPKSLDDCDLLLNDYSTMNTSYPTLGEIATDDYYLTDANWKSISIADERNTYIWSHEPIVLSTQWMNSYKVIYQANQVLELLDQIEPADEEGLRNRELMAAALFFRGFAQHQLLAVFSGPYVKATATENLGIPLRLDTKISKRSVRASLLESYNQVVRDYTRAAQGLPAKKVHNGRPYKASAYAALARLFLDMSDYEMAYAYADSALLLQSSLMDFNTLTVSASLPIPRFNTEVIFAANTPTVAAMGQSFAKIDSLLYKSYNGADLRKKAYFKANTGINAGTYAFKGSYDNSPSGLFIGLTTSEMYLIRAEAAIRLGNKPKGVQDIKTLLKNRWTGGIIPAVDTLGDEDLLDFLLEERRRELVFRGRRWSDLKRLNQEPRFAKTILRYVNNQEYVLKPNGLEYAVCIPEIVISESQMEQNKR